MSKPIQEFIEKDGLIYKLYESKEERLRRKEREEKRIAENLGKFRSIIGEKHCDLLHKNKSILSIEGEYTSTHVNFSDWTTWTSDEYTTGESKPIGSIEFETNRYATKDSHFVNMVREMIMNFYYYNPKLLLEEQS